MVHAALALVVMEAEAGMQVASALMIVVIAAAVDSPVHTHAVARAAVVVIVD